MLQQFISGCGQVTVACVLLCPEKTFQCNMHFYMKSTTDLIYLSVSGTSYFYFNIQTDMA